MTAYEVFLELAILLAFWSWLGVWQRDRATAGRRVFMGLCVACAVWSFGNMARETGALDPSAADRISFLGIAWVPGLWCGLALHHARLRIARRRTWLPVALATPSLLAVGLLYDPRLAPLFIDYHADGSFAWGARLLVPRRVVLGARLGGDRPLLRGRLRSQRRGDWGRGLAVAAASLLPLLANLYHVVAGAPGPDPSPVVIAAALMVMRSTAFSGGLLQLLPVSHQDIIHTCPRRYCCSTAAARSST